MCVFELADIMFLVKALKNRSDRFNVLQFVQLQDLTTRSSDRVSLKYVRYVNNLQRHFYAELSLHLWNKMPAIDLYPSLSLQTIRSKLYEVMWSNFIENFNSDDVCSFHFFCPCSRCVIK